MSRETVGDQYEWFSSVQGGEGVFGPFDESFVDWESIDERNELDFSEIVDPVLNPDEARGDDGGYNLSAEQLHEWNRIEPDLKTPGDWEKDCEEDLSKMVISVNKAKSFAWKQAKVEFGMLVDSFEANGWDLTTEGVLDVIFGERSRLYHVFSEELHLGFEDYCLFLATYYAACELSISVPHLYESDLIVIKGLMEQNDYKKVLRKIAKVPEIGETIHDETLWMKFEEAFNSTTKKMMLSKRGNNLLKISLDDDKLWFNYSSSKTFEKYFGLKPTRHVRDNRLGHTAHTAGFAASSLPLCIMFERRGEKQVDVYCRMMKRIFGTCSGDAEPELHNVELESDRGYMTAQLIRRLLKWNADVTGTVARSFWYPFTFSHEFDSSKTDSHGRTQVTMKGYRDTMYQTLNLDDGRKLRATCYRSGTGTAVALTISSLIQSQVFDLNLSFPKDSKWYFSETLSQDERDKMAFTRFHGVDDHKDLLLRLPMKPLTTVQGDVSWFILRKFSLTSSTMNSVILKRAKEIYPSHPMRETFEEVLKITCRREILPSCDPIVESDGDNNNDDETISLENDDPIDQTLPSTEASYWIKKSEESIEHRALLNNELIEKTLREETAREIARQHENGHTVSSGRASMLFQKLIEWNSLECKYRRRYFFLNVSHLKEKLEGLSKSKSGNKCALLDRLVDASRIQDERMQAIGNGGDPFSPIETGDADPVWTQVFKTAYMRPLKNDQKAYCRLGHELERPYLDQLYEHSQKGLTGKIKIHSIFSSPLVQSLGKKEVLDSADGEIVYEIVGEGELKVMPVECKSRLAPTVFFDERENYQAILGGATWEQGLVRYVHLDYDNPQVFKWIPRESECFQLLHHVVMRNSSIGLIIIGDRSKVMFGVFIQYSEGIKDAYRNLLQDLYDRCLSWAYNPVQDLPMEKIEAILKSDAMRPARITRHAFLTSFHIWRKLRVELFDSMVKNPLPPCNRILPYSNSYWNTFKVLSDTQSNLLEKFKAPLAGALSNSQSVAIGRIFQSFASMFHRVNHFATASDDLNSYPSLFHFRNARNASWPFHKSLRKVREWLVKQSKEYKERRLPIATNNTVSFVSTPPRTAMANPRRAFTEARIWLPKKTNATPKRGKSKFPVHRGADFYQDQERLANCHPGYIYAVATRDKNGEIVDSKSPCFICDTKTKFYCISCKRYYCFVDRDEKIKTLIQDKNEVVAFLGGNRPPHIFEASDGSNDTKLLRNSCYHIRHKRLPLAEIELS